jgi:hypothetical protein
MNRASAIVCLALTGCFTHRVQTDPIEVKPIHVTVDVNVRVQRELDEFFDFEQQQPSETRASGSERKQP